MTEGLYPSHPEEQSLPLSLVNSTTTELSLLPIKISAMEQLMQGGEEMPVLKKVEAENSSRAIYKKLLQTLQREEPALDAKNTNFLNEGQIGNVLKKFTAQELPDKLFSYMFWVVRHDEQGLPKIGEKNQEKICALFSQAYLTTDIELPVIVKESITQELVEEIKNTLTAVDVSAQLLARKERKGLPVPEEMMKDLGEEKEFLVSQYMATQNLFQAKETIDILSVSDKKEWEVVQSSMQKYLGLVQKDAI